MKRDLSVTVILSIMLPFLGAAASSATDKAVAIGVTVAGKALSLRAADIKKIRTLQKDGVTVFYPGSLPAGFKLSTVTIDNQDSKHPDYGLNFCNGKTKFCFTVETAHDGIGDGPDGDKTYNGKSKIFGKFSVDYFKPFSEGNGTKDDYYLSSWMRYKKPGSASDQERFYHLYGNGITARQAVAIIESLAEVK
ncbi:MAG TPA: hypothetical protein V6C72_05580 [Chroococcales cyanobacterium]